VHYEGSLETGKVFDSSYPRKPIEFKLIGQVIDGTKGSLMGKRVIPSDLGYGPAGVIPPNATLIFDLS
jgi:peptidyl-prolyl cis-trans isomerase A (cyclophilin A)